MKEAVEPSSLQPDLIKQRLHTSSKESFEIQSPQGFEEEHNSLRNHILKFSMISSLWTWVSFMILITVIVLPRKQKQVKLSDQFSKNLFLDISVVSIPAV